MYNFPPLLVCLCAKGPNIQRVLGEGTKQWAAAFEETSWQLLVRGHCLEPMLVT